MEGDTVPGTQETQRIRSHSKILCYTTLENLKGMNEWMSNSICPTKVKPMRQGI